MFRDEPVTRVMKRTNPLGFVLRELEPFAKLAQDAGWRVDEIADDNPVYHVVCLRKAGGSPAGAA
jgi:hypothetical protein